MKKFEIEREEIKQQEARKQAIKLNRPPKINNN